MKEFTIINSAKKTPLEMNEKDFYRSQSAGDATSKIEEVCRENPDTHITVYGGDGSVYEAVNAIMRSGITNAHATMEVDGVSYTIVFEAIREEGEE